MSRLMTIQQAAEMLGVSTDFVRRKLPELGAVDLNRGASDRRMIRIPETAINAYLRGCEIMKPLPMRRVHIERRKA